MKRKVRVWTPEQRQAAAERMRVMQAQKKAERGSGFQTIGSAPETIVPVVPYVRPPEVQAVLDSMTDAQRARLAGMQARVFATTTDGTKVLERHNQEKLAALSPTAMMTQDQVAEVRDERRVGSRELRLIVRTDGTMVSQDGPCVCGRNRREWHAICLKQTEKNHV